MALSFVHGATEYVNHGSDVSLDDMDPCTIMAWVKVDALDASERNLLINKESGTDEGLSFYVGFNSGSPQLIAIRQSTTATWHTATAVAANFTHWGTGKWVFVVAVLNFGGTARLLVGDLSNVPAEPSAYTSQVAGTGAVQTDAANDLIVANGRGIATFWRFGGDVATKHIVEEALTNQQIIQQWMRFSLRSTSRLFPHYGFNGTGTQADWSGNLNNGTITGNPTVVDHVPLGPMFGFDVSLPFLVAAPPGGIIPRIMYNRRLRAQ